MIKKFNFGEGEREKRRSNIRQEVPMAWRHILLLFWITAFFSQLVQKAITIQCVPCLIPFPFLRGYYIFLTSCQLATLWGKKHGSRVQVNLKLFNRLITQIHMTKHYSKQDLIMVVVIIIIIVKIVWTFVFLKTVVFSREIVFFSGKRNFYTIKINQWSTLREIDCWYHRLPPPPPRL